MQNFGVRPGARIRRVFFLSSFGCLLAAALAVLAATANAYPPETSFRSTCF